MSGPAVCAGSGTWHARHGSVATAVRPRHVTARPCYTAAQPCPPAHAWHVSLLAFPAPPGLMKTIVGIIFINVGCGQPGPGTAAGGPDAAEWAGLDAAELTRTKAGLSGPDLTRLS